ncbi:MAG: ABC transporter substrate-binding protein [Prevotellaceae bacterium]|nr:ABC transporter substrate-binding protein [Prevotellaceae bacterium]MDO4931708.1 ABC transporter substrate-binding protein [Prevotellaceae bacterium]
MTQKIKYIITIIAMALCCGVKAQTVRNTVNVGVMLPLHNVDGDGRRMIEYYRGMLLAIEKLKNEGTNVNVRAWNVPIDADIRTTLLNDGATDCNIIFGPLYSKQVEALGNFCKAYNIKMVIPFSISGNDVDKNPNIYQVYQSPDELNSAAIQHVVEQFGTHNIVIIDCNDTTSRKGTFTFALRKVLEQKKVGYHITNLNSSNEMFAKAFSLTKANLVILNTGRSPELTAAMNKLDALVEDNKNVKVSLFGYTEWLMYAKYNKARFAKYDTYVPSNFYYNEASPQTVKLEESYRQSFHEGMTYALPHFAITGYDHAMYFIGNRRQWLQSPLNFKKTNNGGYRNKAFMLIHYKTSGGIEALSY